MLDLELDLEADLGVDTVKQAEMFAAIREIYNIPRDENRKLRDYPTLAHVIRFVFEKRPDLAQRHSSTPKPNLSSPTRCLVTDEKVAAPPAAPIHSQRNRAMRLSKNESSPWWSRKPAIRRTCWTLNSISKPIWASTRSSRRRCSPRSARSTTSRAMKIASCATIPTLAHVIRFVYEKRPDLALAVPPARRH